MRFLRFLIIAFCITSLILPSAAEAGKPHRRGHSKQSAASSSGVKDPRYAALIMNPETGEVYHEKDADARRYPASLTKMMTLYLLFEALESEKLSLRTKLRVSEYASTMPQTNLSLSPGDEIPVETAIKSLVVRSANDVSVVVAEALGGDVDNFATMMTIKAHQLGMSKTQFANPNGLPNASQYTTARDMAKLGIALKRDFPQYYPYFAVREFSWAGTSYYTHNRVMLRYAGVDGIKTGFIGTSGFNLVTSCKRGGRPLIGVVMGGSSGRWRDDRMITLLNEGYKIVASRGATRGKMVPANLPLAKDGSEPVAEAASPDAPAETAAMEEPTQPQSPVVAKPVETAPAKPQAAPPPVPAASTAPVKKTVLAAPPVNNATPETPKTAAAAPLIAVKPTVLKAPDAVLPVVVTNWGIQVGAFSTKKLATQAGQKAFRAAKEHLQGAKIVILPPQKSGPQMHRVRLENITEYQATKACELLSSSNVACFTYRADVKGN
jgi:D-alanyl-D-alanine carboxypeptidase